MKTEAQAPSRTSRAPHHLVISDQRGFSMVLVFVMIFATMTMGLVLLDYSSQRAKNAERARQILKRDNLIYYLKSQTRVGPTLYASIAPDYKADNIELYKCMIHEATDTPLDCRSHNQRRLFFISEDGVKLTGKGDGDYAYFDIDAKPCDPSETRCWFRVWTEFDNTCDNGYGWNCSIARQLVVNYHVETQGTHVPSWVVGRDFRQVIAVADWAMGPWAIVGYSANIWYPPTPAPSPTSPPTSSPPTPAPPIPDPVPIPVVNSTCPAGSMISNGECVGYSL